MIPTPLFEPFARREERIVLSAGLVRRHRWTSGGAVPARHGGYRDLENVTTSAIWTCPSIPPPWHPDRGRLPPLPAGDTVHLGGEVRPWTQEFIDLAARIYAARGIAVRVRGERDADGPIRTTPIWMSPSAASTRSCPRGELHRSHSQSYKAAASPWTGVACSCWPARR